MPQYIVTTKVFDYEIKYLVSSARSYWRARHEFQSEPELINLIDQLSFGKAVMFDIGANIGTYSLYAAKKGFKVVSLEPHYINSFTLSKNIELNQLEDQIISIKMALSNYSGISELIHHKKVQAGNSGATIESYFEEDLEPIFKEYVMVSTIDDLILRLNLTPTLIKIDTDGNELNVLKGAVRELSSRNILAIFIEVSSIHEKQAVIEFLSEYGYSLKEQISKSNSIYMLNLIFTRD